MPMAMLRLKPGTNVEMTPSQLEAGYAVSNLIRFRNGLAEKLGGWIRYYTFAVGGIPRALHAWLDLSANKYLGVGSTTILGVITGDTPATRVLTTLTPQTKTTNPAVNFSTTLNSTSVTITDASIANVTTFDSIYLDTPVAIGGIILAGYYPIISILGTTQYTITSASAATATVPNAGAVPSFATTSGNATVTVTLTAHGLSDGDSINFPISTTVGGVTILGTYPVLNTTANTFVINVTTQATSSTSASMNSGLARIVYYIALGPATTTTGYSVGGYSTGGYSTGSTTTAQTGDPITATDWSLDNWGQTFLANPEGGAIYSWTPNTGFENAQALSGADAPAFNNAIFVSMQTQMLIALGSTVDHEIGASQDPLLVKWSDQGDYTSWQISTTSQAGSRRLPTGSKIVGGMSVPGNELIWTDLDLWSMNYLGSLAAGVWGFTKVGSNCGLIGKHAAVRQGSQVYWMSASNFWVTGSGQPAVIPCTVWDSVFQDLNTTYQSKCWAWSNTPFNEVWFMFPRESTGAIEPDAYVKFNTRENVWDNTVQPFDRSAGIDQSLLGMPIAATSGGIIYEHEVSPDADGQALNAYFTTGLYQLSEGQDINFIDWWLPDMRWTSAQGGTSASIQITIFSQYYLSDTPQTHGPYTVTSASNYFNPRVRGRFISYKVESNDIGSFWRFGGSRARLAQDGRL